uniref:Uncharacterized protein n=1 Tax=Meloidogyne enterolobii TaxID=390850 RepID=A0A6V7WII8_MELEN|nr:unnamed protein product [Meloidogyne enterolobii]
MEVGCLLRWVLRSFSTWTRNLFCLLSKTSFKENFCYFRYGNIRLGIKARTSGAAFAVGIGSFVAYKMLCRLIKSNSIWTALEQLSPTDEQKDHQKASVSTNNEAVILAEGFYAVRLGGENELLRRLDEFLSASTASKADEIEGKPHVAVVQVRQANALKRLFRRNQHLQGIASMDQQINLNNSREENEEKIKNNTIASRGYKLTNENDEDNEGNLSDCSQLSCNTSASRAFCLNNQNDSDSSSICSGKSLKTNKSALLNLNCENELFWEDEFSNERVNNRRELGETEEIVDDEGLFIFREREGSLGGLSQLSAMKNLEKMFSNDWLDKNTNEEDIEDGDSLVDNALDNLRELSSLDDVANAACSCSSFVNTTQTKQQDNISNKSRDEPRLPFTAYKIVLQNELSESSSSLCGGSTRSDRFGRYCCPSSPHRQQRKRLEAAPVCTSQGLWELTKSDGINSRSTSEKQCLELYRRKERSNNNNNNQLGPMVDSIISINSHASSSMATSSSAQIQMPNSGAMIDSAIGTDFQSSADDDDWKEQCIEDGETTENVNTRPRTKSGVFRRYGGEVDSSKGIILRPLSKISEQQSATATPVKKTTTLAITKSNSISTSSLDGSESSLEWF